MNTQSTLQDLRQLHLYGMENSYYQHLQTNHLGQTTTDEFLAYLVEAEKTDRNTKRTQRLLKQAHFKLEAHVSEIDYHAQRELDKNMFIRLTSLDFIRQKENIIITGPSGTGKTFLATALGYVACTTGLKCIYGALHRIMAQLILSKKEERYLNKIRAIAKMDLLILDDFGLHPIKPEYRQILMDIIDDRFNIKSTIICSQLPVKAWHELIGEPTVADAILDRIIHNAHRIELKGESMRKRKINQLKKSNK